MAKKDDSIFEIAPIAGEILPAIRLGSGLSSLVEALNPLGTIGKAITDLLVCRIATKKIEVERERIRKQAEVINVAMQTRLAHELRQFEIQREALLNCVKHSETVLLERRVSRAELIKALNNITRTMTTLAYKESPPIEVIGIYRDSLGIISGKLVELEKAGTDEVVALSQELHAIVGQVRRELEDMPPINKLLPPSQ